MTNYQAGHAAERRAAAYLMTQGYIIRELNWKTRFCEIDIVAEQQHCIYFVEVKYRRSEHWGTGLDYITPIKLRRMRFASEIWLAHHAWQGECRLAAIAISGNDCQMIFIDA